MPTRPRPFKWNQASGRYINSQGRFVSRVAVRDAIDNAIDVATRDARALSERLRNREISVAEWQRGMMRSIKDVHLYNAAGAKGGWAQLSASDLGRVGQEVKQQYQYLQNFARQIEQGLPLDGRFLVRTGMYMQAGRKTFEETNRQEATTRGFTEELNLRHSTDGCNGCIFESGKGWVPIGTLLRIGNRTCLSACKCTIIYRKSTGERY